MNEFVDRYCWCALQVTLFASIGTTLYLLLRKQSPLRSSLPVQSLAVIATLSLLTVVPWPSWKWQTPLNHLATTVLLSPEQNKTPDIDFLIDFDLPASSAIRDSANLLIPPADPKPPMPVSKPLTQVDSLEWWKKSFVFLAASITLAALLRLLIATRGLLTRTRTSKSIEDTSILGTFEQLQTQFQLSRKVSLRESFRNDMPSTIGWRKPIILLPQSCRNWSPAQLRAVLAHELAHIQNHDFATWIAVQAPLLLHSYHPLVQWLARRVRWEQEISADRLAVEVLGDRNAYLTALAELALGQSNRRGPFTNFSLAPTSSMLLGRLKMLRQTSPQTVRPVPRLRRILLLAMLCSTAITVSGLRGNQSTATADDAPKQPQPNTEASPNQIATSERDPQIKPSDSSDTVTISALLKFAPPRASSIGNESPKVTQAERDLFFQTQIVLLRSNFVLRAAIHGKALRESLPLLRRHSDPLAWLSQNLAAGRVQKSSILRIQLLHCPREEADSGVKIVDAIINAFREEVLYKDRGRQEEQRVELTTIQRDIHNELRQKIDKRNAVARELGGIGSDVSKTLTQLATKRLDRIETNLERLEEEQLLHEIELKQVAGEPSSKQKIASEFFLQRIAQLKQRREELIQEVEDRNTPSAQLAMLESEIEQLQEVQKTIAFRLSARNIEREIGYSKMQILQSATVDPAANQ